jgi:lipid-binding SYLF domain-containing protein
MLRKKRKRFMNTARPRRMTLAVLAILQLSFAGVNAPAQKPPPAKAVKQSKKAADLLERAMAKPEERIPKVLLTGAVAVAVLTDVKRMGLLIEGVASGRGVVSRRLPNGTWSAPAFIGLAALNIAPQLHASKFDVIMLFMNDKAAGWLLNDKAVLFDRVKAPVAGPVGEIRTDLKEVVPVADVFSYVFDDGHLAGKDLKNLLKDFVISFDNDLNKATYGLKAGGVLSDVDGAKVREVPAEMTVFPATVSRYFGRE